MAVQNLSSNDERDSFFQLVQQKLVEALELDDAEITVDRHHGKNETVVVGVKLKAKKQSDHDEGSDSSKQLSQRQLNQINSILDDLLENCTMEFGDITFVVTQGQLEKTVFSYSTRPNESSERHFSKTI